MLANILRCVMPCVVNRITAGCSFAADSYHVGLCCGVGRRQHAASSQVHCTPLRLQLCWQFWCQLHLLCWHPPGAWLYALLAQHCINLFSAHNMLRCVSPQFFLCNVSNLVCSTLWPLPVFPLMRSWACSGSEFTRH
jgi:hypothetical protein